MSICYKTSYRQKKQTKKINRHRQKSYWSSSYLNKIRNFWGMRLPQSLSRRLSNQEADSKLARRWACTTSLTPAQFHLTVCCPWKLKPLLSCHSPHSSGSVLMNFTDRGDTTRTLPGTKVLFFPLKRDSYNIQLLKTPPTQIFSPSRGDSLQSQQQLCTSPLTDLRWLHYQGPPYPTDAA